MCITAAILADNQTRPVALRERERERRARGWRSYRVSRGMFLVSHVSRLFRASAGERDGGVCPPDRLALRTFAGI